MCPSSPYSVDESPSSTVIEAVAAEMGVQPTELPEQLFDAIDADALDSLFRGRERMDGKVTFSYCGYIITVTSDGTVTVDG